MGGNTGSQFEILAFLKVSRAFYEALGGSNRERIFPCHFHDRRKVRVHILIHDYNMNIISTIYC